MATSDTHVLPPAALGEARRLMTLREVADCLRVSQATVRRWTNAGQLRCYRLGGPRSRRMFSMQQVREFLAQYESGAGA